MSKTEARLRVFAKWLQDSSDSGIYNGQLERYVNETVIETRREIGSMLDEILDLEEEELLRELQ
jgi:hypothetical protein